MFWIKKKYLCNNSDNHRRVVWDAHLIGGDVVYSKIVSVLELRFVRRRKGENHLWKLLLFFFLVHSILFRFHQSNLSSFRLFIYFREDVDILRGVPRETPQRTQSNPTSHWNIKSMAHSSQVFTRFDINYSTQFEM